MTEGKARVSWRNEKIKDKLKRWAKASSRLSFISAVGLLCARYCARDGEFLSKWDLCDSSWRNPHWRRTCFVNLPRDLRDDTETQHVLLIFPLWSPYSKLFIDFIAICFFVRLDVGWPDPFGQFKEDSYRMCEALFWDFKQVSFLWDILSPCLLRHAVLGCSPVVRFSIDAGIRLMLWFSTQAQSRWTVCTLASFSNSLGFTVSVLTALLSW